MIVKICKIKNGKYRSDKFSADITDLPGSPELGFGKSAAQAIANVMMIHSHEITQLKENGHESIKIIESERTHSLSAKHAKQIRCTPKEKSH